MRLFLNTMIILMGAVVCTAQAVEECKLRKDELGGSSFKLVNTERTPKTSKEGPKLLIYISVTPKQINRDDLVMIGSSLRKRFCRETNLVAMIFDNTVRAKFFNPDFNESRDALRGTYVFDQKTGEEYVSFVKIPDYFGNPSERIRVDLNR